LPRYVNIRDFRFLYLKISHGELKDKSFRVNQNGENNGVSITA
jgi:hypothetical protein